MMKPKRPGRVRCAIAARAEWGAEFEQLEPRVLLSTYLFQPIEQGADLREVIASIDAPARTEGFGDSLAGLGDLDGDGFADFAIGAPGAADAQGATVTAGRAFVYSGHTRELLFTLDGQAAGFGRFIRSAHDVDGDGVGDVLVTSPRFDADANGLAEAHGRVYLYSGSDGSLIHVFEGSGPADEFGFAIDLIDDLNGGGSPDLIVGAPGAGAGGEGRVYVFALEDFSNIYTFAGQQSGERFGHAVQNAGDVKSGVSPGSVDGVSDILVGSPRFDASGLVDAGRVYLFDGIDGTLRRTYEGNAAGDLTGSTVRRMVPNEVGVVYVLAGVPGFDGADGPSDADYGALITFDALTGARLLRVKGPYAGARLGSTAEPYDRYNVEVSERDVPAAPFDFATVPDENGRIRYFDVLGGGPQIEETIPLRPEHFGSSVDYAGDVDGDGVRDLLALDPNGSGAVRLIHGRGWSGIQSLTGTSDDGRYLYSEVYAIADGVFTSVVEMPGLGLAAHIERINSDGLILGSEPVDAANASAGRVYFFVRDGVRTTLADAIVEIRGAAAAPDLTRITIRALGNGGDLVFRSFEGPSEPTRAWHFKAGVLTLLWEGDASDVNDLGVVLGTRLRAGETIGTTVVRSADGEMTELPGFFNAGPINNAGTVAGEIDGKLGLWDGVRFQTVDLAPVDRLEIMRRVLPLSIDADGRVLVSLTRQFAQEFGPPTSPIVTETIWLYEPTDGARTLQQAVFNLPQDYLVPPVNFGTGAGFDRNPDSLPKFAGEMIVLANGLAGTDVAARLVMRDDAPSSVVSLEGETVIVGVNTFNDVILIERSSLGQHLRILWSADDDHGAGTEEEIVAFLHPADGRVFVAVSTPENLRLFAPLAGGAYS